MATQLNQVLAVEKTLKGDTAKELTDLHRRVQKAPLLSGVSRTYRPKDDADRDLLPPESTQVQVRVEEVLTEVKQTLTKLFDVTATKDWTNCLAKADIIVDGRVLLAEVPVTYLLFLEKKLVDLETFFRKLPTLDPADPWEYDDISDLWQTQPVETTRTKKVPRNHVKAAATERHPAQVEVYMEDVLVGYWRTIKFSGALPARRVNELLTRVLTLGEAVKMAREKANSTEIVNTRTGKAIFDYLLG